MDPYAELLRDPRWQKKRLEILQRDSWTCRSCGASDRPLHVHHTWYERERAPWDYPEDSLVALCEECHASEPRAMELTSVQRRLAGIGKIAVDVDLLVKLTPDLKALCPATLQRLEQNLRSFPHASTNQQQTAVEG